MLVSRSPKVSSIAFQKTNPYGVLRVPHTKNNTKLPEEFVNKESHLQEKINCGVRKQFTKSSKNAEMELRTVLSFSKTKMGTQQRKFSTDNLPSHSVVGLPSLSPTMEQGNVGKWKKKEGDKVAVGDILCEIETDKTTIDFENTDSAGYLAKILVPDGTRDLKVNTPIAIIVENKNDIAAFKDYKAAAPAAPAAKAAEAKPVEQPKPVAQAPAPTPAPKATPVYEDVIPGAPPSSAPKLNIIASPRAKLAAQESGVNLAQVSGTGPSGRIIVADVVEFAQKAAEAPAPAVSVGTPGSYTDIPNTQIRRVIAKRLLQSKQTIPHYYLTTECKVDKLLQLRQSLNDQAPKANPYKLSVNDFIIKASGLALMKVPDVNSTWTEDFIRRFNYADINVAVSTDRGLMTPLVQNCNQIGLIAISSAVKRLADKARAGKILPAELESGTFSISNLGMFGIKQFAAVINPPQACILAVGGTESKVVVNENGDKANPYTVSQVMTVTLSCDHRVVDGATGAAWLKEFKDLIEDPVKMLL